jgi:hypothetical protein
MTGSLSSGLFSPKYFIFLYVYPFYKSYVQATFEVLLDDVIGGLGPGAYLKHSKNIKLKSLKSDKFCIFHYFYSGLVLGSVIDILTSRPESSISIYAVSWG